VYSFLPKIIQVIEIDQNFSSDFLELVFYYDYYLILLNYLGAQCFFSITFKLMIIALLKIKILDQGLSCDQTKEFD